MTERLIGAPLHVVDRFTDRVCIEAQCTAHLVEQCLKSFARETGNLFFRRKPATGFLEQVQERGERVETGEDSVVEAVELLGLVSGELGVELDEEDIGAVEAEVLSLQDAEGAEEEASTGEEHEGEHDLRGDEDIGEQAA